MLAETARRLLSDVMELAFQSEIILDDVDMDYAVRTATFGSFFIKARSVSILAESSFRPRSTKSS